MSATVAIRAILVDSAALTVAVPAARIIIGDVPLASTLPVIGITLASCASRNTLSMREPRRLVRDRVQVTVYAATYPSLDVVIELVRRAVPNTRGLVAGLNVQAVLPGIVGPDLKISGPQILTRSVDYHVTYLR